ncbi:MAG: pseudouridine synthase [Parachlamydiales bacterium]
MTSWRCEEPLPLRTFLSRQLSLSLRQVNRFLDQNRCQVNGRFERFGSRRLVAGDRVVLEVEERTRGEPKVLFEDPQLLVLDKPAGWTSERCAEWARATLVHRLDRDTSGVLLLAKGDPAHLEDQFRKRLVEKHYLAVVVGVPRQSSGEITSHLALKGTFSGQKIYGSAPTGKLSKTSWELLFSSPSESLLRCTPHTGRTHQIRVHLAEMGHPVVGDGQYGQGGRMPGRHLLHAESLTLIDPAVTFTSPAPPEIACAS